MKKLTINRRTWLRGEGSEESYLRRAEDGKMCCLGFAAIQLGKLSEDDITSVQSLCGFGSRGKLPIAKVANELMAL